MEKLLNAESKFLTINTKWSLSILPKLNQHKKFLPKVPIISNMGHSSHLESYATYDELYVKKNQYILTLRRESKLA